VLASSLLYPGRTGHAQAIWAIAVTPDGKRLVTGDEQNLILLWDLASGRQLRSFVCLPAWVELGINSIAVTPDGKRLVTASNDNTTRVWEMETGKELHRISRSGYSTCVAVFPDGQRLATVSGVSDIATGREILTLREQGAYLAISPDGRRLATASFDGAAMIWNLESGGASRTLEGHTGEIQCVTVTADGQWIITGSADRTAKVWDVASGRELFKLEGHTEGVDAVAVSADRQRIITGSSDVTADGSVYGAIRVWDAASGQLLQKLEGDTRDIRSIAVTPDGHWLVSGGLGAAQLWDLTSSPKPRTLTPPSCGIITSIVLDQDGQRVFTGCLGGTISLWDIEGGKELFQVSDNAVMSFAVLPRRQRLVTGSMGGAVTVWDTAARRELFSLHTHNGSVASIAVTSDEQRFITGSEDGTVRIWDAVSARELLILDGHSGPVNSVAVTPDGSQLVTACNDGPVKIWEAASPAQVALWTRQDQEMERRRALWQRPGRNADGFIHEWLVLGPLALKENETGAKGLERQQLPPKASLHPQAGDHVLVDGQKLTWQAHHENEPTLELNQLLAKGRNYCAAYVVCYVICAMERNDLLLQVASCEQAKVYLNGQQVYQYTRGGTAALEPIGPVRLRKGMNLLLIKNVKDNRNWNVCARFVDQDGNPAQGLEVRLTPD
jgi:WD40 repeat protein